MATVYQPVLQQTYPASADLSAVQFTFCKFSTGKIATCGAGDQGLGVQQNKPNAADLGTVVMLYGTSKLKVDGSGTPIVAGSLLAAGTAGVGVVAGTGDVVMAMALEGSTAAGDIISVFLMPGAHVSA